MPRASKKGRNQSPAPRNDDDTRTRTLVQVQESSWEGPLPPPNVIEEFDRIVPGAAERIIKEWETEADHRRKFERRALNFEGVERIGARILAFLFAVAALGAAVYMATIGATAAAAIVGGTTIASVVASMLFMRRR